VIAAVAIAATDRLEIGAALPFVTGQYRAAMSPGSTGELAPIHAGFGDLGLTFKVGVARARRTGVDVALLAELSLPTGQGDYRGERGPMLAPAVAVSRELGLVRLAANAGWRMRRQVTILNLRVDDELFGEAGASVHATPCIDLQAGLSFATSARAPFEVVNQSYGEARLGATFQITSMLQIDGVLGAGLLNGFGTPDWRGVLALRFGRVPPPASE
jgi:hypothetical protein